MMAAMMLPAAMPMVLVFASAQARRNRRVAIPTWIFIAGYLLVWGISGLLLYGVTQATTALVNRHALGDRAMWTSLALAATLTVAGVYQFMPLKRICLRHCRSPFGFVAQH